MATCAEEHISAAEALLWQVSRLLRSSSSLESNEEMDCSEEENSDVFNVKDRFKREHFHPNFCENFHCRICTCSAIHMALVA